LGKVGEDEGEIYHLDNDASIVSNISIIEPVCTNA
jgi:hypothetical protein